jgi:glucose/arabinose dehydrogenase
MGRLLSSDRELTPWLAVCSLLVILLTVTFNARPTLAQGEPPGAGPSPQVTIARNVNLRSGPGTGYAVLAVARSGENYPVTGKSSDGRWWRVELSGEHAWIFASLVEAANTDAVAVVPAEATTRPSSTRPAPAASTDDPLASVAQRMNVRGGPGTNYPIVGSAQAGSRFAITGKNAAGTWWQIDFSGRPGWLFAGLVQATNAGQTPVVNAPPQPAASSSPQAATPANMPASSFDPQLLQFRLETVLGGLSQPTQVTNAGDGSGRLFVLERGGRILVFAGAGGEAREFLDIRDRVGDAGPEQGLLGLAFAPDYAASGLFYINYTDENGDTVIGRYRLGEDWNQANRESETQVLWIDQPAANHNGGMLAFGPDGRLWIGLGDGGGANDTYGNGQNPGTLLGTILRLDVTGDPGAPYRIPANNPWVASGWQGQVTRGELWAFGLRNPWRFSFDRATGDLWIADVGQDLFEEINFVPAAQVRTGGFNFGWPVMEGMHCRGGAACDRHAYVAPVAEYGHAGNGCSVTGGYVYRGQAYAMLRGVYFYGDFCSGNIWALWRTPGGELRNALVLPNAAAISSFGEDEAGELYVTEFGGTVRRLVAEER